MGFFSRRMDLAACLGALIGFIMIVFGITPFWHFTMIAVIILLITMSSRSYLQEDMEQVKVEEEVVKEDKSEKWQYIKRPEMLLIKLGLVGLFALIVESAMFDWSGVYFESVLRVPKSLQIGFLVFMVMMTVGRFLANYAYRILGKQRVLQLSGAFIFLGFFISALLGKFV